MTDPVPAHGCMIDGQPAMPILISEYNALVTRVAELERSLRDSDTDWLELASHNDQTCEAVQRRDSAEAAVARVQAVAAEHPAGIDTALIHEALDGPTPAAPQGGTPNETASGVAASPPIPDRHRFTAVHVTPEMGRAAAERARQMAEAHEQAVQSLVLAFGGQGGDHPSRRAELRDLVAAAIWERQNPGRIYADCEHPWQADAEEDANAVLALLYREWPWLRAEAEDAGAPTAVDALYEQWVKAGPPPLGVPLARWWDKRLVELRNAINTEKEN